MSKRTEAKADKERKEWDEWVIENLCQRNIMEREEMWEKLGMNWKENSCLPAPKKSITKRTRKM